MGLPPVQRWISLNAQTADPVALAGNLLVGKTAGAMDRGARHLAAGHVQGHYINQAIAADAATHLHRRRFRQVRRQSLDPAFADADAGVGLRRLALQHLDANALLIFNDRAIDPAGRRRQLRVFGNQNIVDALLAVLDLDAETVRVDVDLDHLRQRFAGTLFHEQIFAEIVSRDDAGVQGRAES